MRKTTVINLLLVVSCFINLPYGTLWEVMHETPLLDGKTLTGREVTTPFRVTRVDDQKQLVFSLEDTLRDIASTGNFANNLSAIKHFSSLNQLACQANVYALGFFASLFQEGTLGCHSLPNVSTQPDRAEFFKDLQALSIAYISTKSPLDKESILKEINSLLAMQKLFDFILDLEGKTKEEYNLIICEIVEVLVKRFGKSQSALASKFGTSRSSIHRIYHKQALGEKATSPTSVGRVLRSQALDLQAFLELTEEEYAEFISELRTIHSRRDSTVEKEANEKNLRHRKLPPAGYEALPYE